VPVKSCLIRFYTLAKSCLLLLLLAKPAAAHVSEQGLVLLLPTDFYISSGVLVVVLTLLLVAVLPAAFSLRIFTPLQFSLKGDCGYQLATVTSLLSLLLCCVLLWIGFFGTHDPLENLLPLVVWTVWWIGFAVLQGVVGDVWRWINPWTGIYFLVKKAGWNTPYPLPSKIGCWPGVVLFMVFMSFALADPAPDDPQRLAMVALAYWCFSMACLLLFGKSWLYRAECFSMLLQRFSQLSMLGLGKDSGKSKVGIGIPGWKLIRNKATSVSAAAFILVLLGCGSFDGLNETFVWLSVIGVNPLEFPGRSAVIKDTITGLLAVNVLLVSVYALCVYVGVRLANCQLDEYSQVSFRIAFCALAVSVLPIAFVYHFAHFLTTFMINGQYAIAAASDPLSNGSDVFSLGSFFVTTGFMNTPDSVKLIWLTQATAVVLGHVLSVLLAHTLAMELFGNARRAIFSQAPLAVFMVIYTFIGLWLLAAPKGA